MLTKTVAAQRHLFLHTIAWQACQQVIYLPQIIKFGSKFANVFGFVRSHLVDSIVLSMAVQPTYELFRFRMCFGVEPNR